MQHVRVVLAAVIATASSSAMAQPIGPRIDAVMKPWAKPDSPGCAIAVGQAGKVTYAKGYGMADLERKVAITPDTVFDIGSVSKQFTAGVILLLAADKALSLDDDIRKHLSELPALSKQPVTIRHLLHHTGGLRDYTALLGLVGKRIEDVATSAETLALLARQKGADFAPGAKHQYSNTGYFLLAQIAERAGKRSMRELVTTRIFQPLKMTKSSVYDSHVRLVPGRALPYARTETAWRHELSQWEQTGDGSVLTTVKDLVAWDANFFTAKLGGQAFVDGMHQKGKTADGTELPYAAGIVHGTSRGQPTVSHGGAWAGYRAFLLRFPQLKTSIAVTCNASDAQPGAYAHEIAGIVLGKRLGPADPKKQPAPAAAATVKLSVAELDAWVGTYRDAKDGSIFQIERDGDALFVAEQGERMFLDPTAKQSVRLRGTPIEVTLSGTAPKRSLVAKAPGFDGKWDEVAPYKAAAADLGALAGHYHCAELGVTWSFVLVKGALVMRIGGVDHALQHTARGAFAVPGMGIVATAAWTGAKPTQLAVKAGSIELRCDRL